MKMLYDRSSDVYTSPTEQRITRHKRSGSDSQTSSTHTLSSAVTRFISAVNEMNDTIMVPCRLLDMEMNSNTNKPVPDLLQAGQDPYAIYGLLNSTKNDVMYGLSSTPEEEEETMKKSRTISISERWSSPTSDTVSQAGSTASNSTTNANSKTNNSNHSRKISSISLMSLGSSSSSDSGADSDITEEPSEDSVSCVSSEESTVTTVAQASAELRQHLSGLHTCLNQLSDTALFITNRYQEELTHGN